MNKSNCIGNSLNLSFSEDPLIKSNENLTYLYNQEITSPKTSIEADSLRKKHNADFMIYGQYSKITNNCTNLQTCFKYSLSKEIKDVTTYNKNDKKEFINVSDIQIINSEFSSNFVTIKYWLAGLSFLKKLEYKQAIVSLEKALDSSDSKNIEIVSLLADCYRQTQNYLKSISLIEKYYPNTINHKLITQKILSFYGIAKYDEALRLFSKIEQLSILDSFALGKIYAEKKDYKNSAKIFEALALDNQPQQFLIAAIQYSKDYHHVEALAALEKYYSKVEPTHKDYAFGLVIYYANFLKDYSKIIDFGTKRINSHSVPNAYEIICKAMYLEKDKRLSKFISEGLLLSPNSEKLIALYRTLHENSFKIDFGEVPAPDIGFCPCVK